MFGKIRNNAAALFSVSGARIPQLDGVRTLAMLMVFCYHLQYMACYLNIVKNNIIFKDIFYGILSNMYLGVDVFFVLSGFLIADFLIREIRRENRIYIGSFYLKRFLRLSPIYYTVLIALYFINVFPGRENIWANFIYVNNFLPNKEMFFPPSWSLAVEEQFYLFLPVFLLLSA